MKPELIKLLLAGTKSISRCPTYLSWYTMQRRCLIKKHYKHVAVCDRWKLSFENFVLDMGIRPHGMTLDRIDPGGNYEPTNCRWATPFTQANNRRDNIKITVNGRTKTIGQWSAIYGISRDTISGRLKDGWSNRDAVTKPAERRTRKFAGNITVDGVSKTIAEWSSATGIKYCTIWARLNRGMSPERAVGYAT